MNYEINARLTSPIFLCGIPFLYYIDFMRKIGIPGKSYQLIYCFSDGCQVAWKPLFISLIFWSFLFHFSIIIERKINPTFKRFHPLVYSVILSILVFFNALLFGGGNNLTTKLAIIWVLGITLLLKAMFSNSSEEIKASPE